MTWRLVLGVIAIQRRSLLNRIVMIGLFSRPIGMPEWLIGGLAVMMAAGTGSDANSVLAKRELAPLPVGARELQRAGWILSALLPLALLTLARCLGGAVHALVTDGTWVFHATPVRIGFEIGFLSLIGALQARVPERYLPDFREDQSALWWFGGVAVMVAVPFVAIPMLPQSVGEVSPALWASVLVALGVGLTTFIRTPAYHHRPRSPTTNSIPESGVTRRKSPTRPGSPARLEGVWALLPGVAGRALAWILVMISFLLVLHLVSVAPINWLPFDSSTTAQRFLGTYCLPMFLVLGMFPGLGHRCREFKRLPLSTHGAAGLLSLAPAVTPVLFWTALAIIQVALAGQSLVAPRLGLLAAFVGFGSLVDAAGIKAGSPRVKHFLPAPVLLALTFIIDGGAAVTAVVEHWALPLAGLLCLAFSWLINLHTLTRSPGNARAFRFNRTHLPRGVR